MFCSCYYSGSDIIKPLAYGGAAFVAHLDRNIYMLQLIEEATLCNVGICKT